jgi:nitrite reductase (NADH) small subunit
MTTTVSPSTVGSLLWTAVCRHNDLLPERGAAAMFDGVQVAVFRLHDGGVRAIGNRDPLCGANVLSRGIVGTRGDQVVVVSPMHKQAFDLDTGRCLDVSGAVVPIYPARVRDGVVEVAVR